MRKNVQAGGRRARPLPHVHATGGGAERQRSPLARRNARRGRRRGRRHGRGRCRRRIKHQILRLHIAHYAVCPDVRPFPRFAQHFHARAVRKNVQAGGGGTRPLPHVHAAGGGTERQRSPLARRNARRGRGHGNALFQLQIALHHIARRTRIENARPIPPGLQHFHARAMRQLAHNAAGRAWLCAQIEPAGRIGQAHHRIDPRGFHRRLRGFWIFLPARRAAGEVPRGIGEFQRAHLNARKIKRQNVAVRHAVFRGHLLRAALAHTHAMPEAARREREPRRSFRDFVRLVVRRIDAKPQRAFQQVIRGQIKGHAPRPRRTRSRGDSEPRLRIGSAGRGIVRGMQRYAINRFYYNTAGSG